MRAMSLVSNEGEGEQNEIRNLQEKLTSTMKLVSYLTSQLNELKEQVICTPETGHFLHAIPSWKSIKPKQRSRIKCHKKPLCLLK